MKGGVRGAVGFKAVKILRRDPCAYCGEYQVYPSKHKKAGIIHATLDHIHPKGRGGKNTWENYAPACTRCNNRKRDNSLLGFLLDADIPSVAERVQFHMPRNWYDPLGIIRRKVSLEELKDVYSV